MAFELESDLQDSVDWGRKRLVDFNAGKTQLDSFDLSNNAGAIDVKMDGSVLKACIHCFLSNFRFSPNDSPSRAMKKKIFFI